MKRITTIFLTLTLALFMFTGCSASKAEFDPNAPSCTFEILKPSEKPVESPEMLLSQQYNFKEGETVKEALTAICKENKIAVSFENSSFGSYVKSMAGFSEKQFTETSGWVFYLNDDWADESCSTLKIKDGDKITWEYITEFVN